MSTEPTTQDKADASVQAFCFYDSHTRSERLSSLIKAAECREADEVVVGDAHQLASDLRLLIQRNEELEEGLAAIQPIACGDWCSPEKHIPECQAARTLLQQDKSNDR